MSGIVPHFVGGDRATGATTSGTALARLLSPWTSTHAVFFVANLRVSDGFLRGVYDVILDRDPLYSTAFRLLLREVARSHSYCRRDVQT